MSASRNNAPTSDNESAERPVREQLRKASIAPTPAATRKSTRSTKAAHSDDEKPRGRLQRKRSHDDVEEEEEPAHKTRHGRKRSRENSPDDDQSSKRPSGEHERVTEPVAVNVPDMSTSTAETATTNTIEKPESEPTNPPESPKTKRSKVETNQEDVLPDATPTTEAVKEESKTDVAKIPAGSGFANTAAASPFASLASTKSPSEKPQAAPSSFASSGFGALAASSTSAFGALGQNKSLSSFASPSPGGTPAPTDENEKPAPKSAFAGKSLGASSGTSAFGGGGATGFGTLGGSGMGGGFGGFGGGSKLTTFASSGTPGVIGSSRTGITAFGVPAHDEEDKSGDEDDGEAEVKSPKPIEGDEKDERFFAQEIETGEENETTEYNCRAKLYSFVDKKEWKERGLGVVRLNVLNPKEGDETFTPKARLVMRSDGSHRVILNTPIQKGLKFGTVTGERPNNGYVYFMGSMDGQPKLELLQMKIRQQFAAELWDHITDLQKQM